MIADMRSWLSHHRTRVAAKSPLGEALAYIASRARRQRRALPPHSQTPKTCGYSIRDDNPGLSLVLSCVTLEQPTNGGAMLQAVVSGKAGRLREGEDPISWRKAFRMSEDPLTASVFGRLAYLDGPVLWRILRRTFGPGLPDFRVAELSDITFWPVWDASGEVNGTVEPDVFLDFKLGDPAISMRLIVEAKFDSYPTQYAGQWVRQWTAYREANGDDGNRVVLAAIGGLGKNVEATVQKIVGEITSLGHEIEVVAAGWDRLLTAIEEERLKPMERPVGRIFDDIVSALALADYQHLRLLGTIPFKTRPWNQFASGALRDFE